MKTWYFEVGFVATVLLAVVLLSHGSALELVGSAAVLASFGHASVSERLAEREAARTRPSVECHRKALWYFVAKEALWFVYFIAHHSYAALVGCGVFLAYPIWRRAWRRWHPLSVIA